MFEKIEELLSSIRIKLLTSEKIRKLLYYNTEDCLEKPAPTIQEVEKLIMLKPIVDVTETSPENNMPSFISIAMTETDIYDDGINTGLKLAIATHRNIWQLNNKKLRPFQIVSEIEKLLNKQKFSTAGKLMMRVVKEVYFTEELVGFIVLLDVVDELGDNLHDF